MNSTSAKPIPVALVGCGTVARMFHAPALKAAADIRPIRVSALVDPVEENLSRLASLFPDAKQFRSLDELTLSSDWLAIVASPPRLHREHACIALKQGAHVLCEKPMAMTVADAEAMIAADEAEGGRLAIGLYRRFFPAMACLRELIATQALGRLDSFEIREGSNYRWETASHSLFNPEMSRGGVLFDVGVHVMDQLIHLIGEPDEIGYEDDAMGGLEANCRVALRYPDGLSGTIRMSKDWDTGNRHRFVFERGEVVWKVGAADRLNARFNGTNHQMAANLLTSDGRPVTLEPQCFVMQLLNVLDHMCDGKALSVPGQEGIRSLRMIEKCYRQRRRLELPWLGAEERSGLQSVAEEVAE